MRSYPLAKLDKFQRAFLKEKRVPESLLFDASGMGPSEYHSLMKEQGKLVAFGVRACKKEGHTLRTRNGTCVQCSPRALDELQNYYLPAHIYIAGSQIEKLTKIGRSRQPLKRLTVLNADAYGGARDWRVLCSVLVDSAGTIESELRSSLDCFAVHGTYWKDGHEQRYVECYSCSYLIARVALLNHLPTDTWPGVQEVPEHVLEDYCW